jgi:aerobic-type carbon monoxide dehydrogenase small subunit (CoxS/CutS family)
MSKDKKKKPKEVTRRQFLAGTGIVVGGAAIGSAALLAACGGDGTTETVTQTQTQTQTQTATQTVTTTAGEVTQTVTTTAPGTTQTQTVTVEVPVGEVDPGLITLTVNGKEYTVKAEADWSLVDVLREKLWLTGTKIGCERGTCGTCTVIMDGRPIYACMVLAVESKGKDIWTVEGLSDGITLDPIQQAFVDGSAVQCGYCIPGYLMSAKVLLGKKANPTRDEVREALSGHFCPCGNTKKIVDAVLSV